MLISKPANFLKMKKIAVIFTLLLIVSLPLRAQETGPASFRPVQFFIGIQPGFSIEPFDDHRYSYDINIVPIHIEYAINRKWSLKLLPKADLLIKPYNLPAEISRIGLGVSVPYHFAKKNSEEGHRGFYLAPHAALTMHKLDNFLSTTVAGELGYCFLFNSVFSFNVGAQVGRTIQINQESSYNQLHIHRAAVIALGIWF